jgi:hypothetical protein
MALLERKEQVLKNLKKSKLIKETQEYKLTLIVKKILDIV